jgi:hypothetical protein
MAATATAAPPAPLRLTVARPVINPWVIALTVTPIAAPLVPMTRRFHIGGGPAGGH